MHLLKTGHTVDDAIADRWILAFVTTVALPCQATYNQHTRYSDRGPMRNSRWCPANHDHPAVIEPRNPYGSRRFSTFAHDEHLRTAASPNPNCFRSCWNPVPLIRPVWAGYGSFRWFVPSICQSPLRFPAHSQQSAMSSASTFLLARTGLHNRPSPGSVQPNLEVIAFETHTPACFSRCRPDLWWPTSGTRYVHRPKKYSTPVTRSHDLQTAQFQL